MIRAKSITACLGNLKAAKADLDAALVGVVLPEPVKAALACLGKAQDEAGRCLVGLWEKESRAAIREAKSSLREV